MGSAHIEGRPPGPAQVRATVLRHAKVAGNKAALTIVAEVLSRMARSRKTGTMMRGVAWKVVTLPDGTVAILVGTNVFYTKFHEQGTGLYGPRNRRIVPVRARALRFPQPGNPGFTLAGRRRSGRAGAQARYVYAKSVRGMRPRRYFADSGLVTRPFVDRIFQQSLNDIVADLVRLGRAA